MELTSAVLGCVDAPTVMETLALTTFPPESVTDAVIVWTPPLSVLEKLPPVPIWPSLLEVQIREAVRVPSWESLAVPAKLMLAPELKVEPPVGLVMETVGGESGWGGGASPTAAGAQTTPSRWPSKL